MIRKMNETIVSMKGICKSFPGVKALDHVDFALRSGEVMALLGENGAGKSTLMKVLSGVYQRDAGELEIFGKRYGDLNPKLAQEVGELPVSKQQMVEIAKALSTHAKVLIMDEPTSALTAREIDDLFRIIRELKSKGCGIVYISHRLEELQHIVDRVAIMRDGQYITSFDFQDASLDEIIAYMVGREIKEKFPRVACKKGRKVFEVKGLNAGRMVRDTDFSLYEGEIVGFAGLMGAGRTETTRAIFGVDPKDSGQIFLDGREVAIKNPRDAIQAGIVLAPEDRKKDGLCTKLSIRHNIALPNLDFLCDRFGVIKWGMEAEACAKAVQDLKIKTPSVEINAANLSGGNQQKVVVGKWLARNSRAVPPGASTWRPRWRYTT